MTECEKVSGKKDIAYHAARAYFDPGKKQLPSLFEIIVRVLNDVRSVLICANLWGAVQTNYLKLQSFERQGENPDLYMLAQFDAIAKPTVGTLHLLRGICEGFPRLYPFIDDVQCMEEISQLKLEKIVQEFPNFTIISEGDRLSVRHRRSERPTIEAIKIPLKSEMIPLSQEFLLNMPDAAVVPPREGQLYVLDNQEETEPKRRAQAIWGYKIVEPGVLSHDALSFLL